MKVGVAVVAETVGSSFFCVIVRVYVSKIVLVPSLNVRSQVLAPTLASVVAVFAAANVAVWSFAPPSDIVIHVGHEPAPVSYTHLTLPTKA